MDRHRSHLVGSHDAEPPALDHGRAAHADRGALDGDHDVTAAEQRGIAGEAAARGDPDQRHLARQPGEEGEGPGVEARDHGGVGVARSTTAALGEEHHRQAQALGELEEPILLGMVALALGAGEDHVVVRHHHAARRLRSEALGVDGGDATDQPVGRGLGDQLRLGAAGPLGGIGEAAVLDQAPLVDEVRHVLPRRAQAEDVALGHALGPGGVGQRRLAGEELDQTVRSLRRRLSLDVGDHAHPTPDHEEVALRHGVADRHDDLGDLHGLRCCDRVLHLHRLDERHDAVGAEGRTERRGERSHRAHHR